LSAARVNRPAEPEPFPGGIGGLDLHAEMVDDGSIMARTSSPAEPPPMANLPRAPQATHTPEPAYGKADSILFQAWIVLFLLVICFALVNYLVSYIPH
jgi:hypothetical protein